VTPLDGGSSAFVHISRFTQPLRRPSLNDLLVYSIEYDKRGRAQANGISFLIPAPSTLGIKAASGGAPLGMAWWFDRKTQAAP
jgi:cold shock CspA family protein